jgi:acyl-CoA thioester hydrolase
MPSIDLNIAPVRCPMQAVEADWIDYNGHMNMAYYHVAFDRALDRVYDALSLGAAYTASGAGSLFTREVRVNYLNEASEGDKLGFSWQLLDLDSKRLHFLQHMYRQSDDALLATSEQLALHVDMTTRRTAPLPEAAQHQLTALHAAHQGLPRPDGLGVPLGIRRR